MSKNICTLFVTIGQNGEIKCFRYGRRHGNRAWPITQEPKEIELLSSEASSDFLEVVYEEPFFMIQKFGPPIFLKCTVQQNKSVILVAIRVIIFKIS